MSTEQFSAQDRLVIEIGKQAITETGLADELADCPDPETMVCRVSSRAHFISDGVRERMLAESVRSGSWDFPIDRRLIVREGDDPRDDVIIPQPALHTEIPFSEEPTDVTELHGWVPSLASTAALL